MYKISKNTVKGYANKKGLRTAKVKDGTYQSIDRIRSLESAKDFNYWPEASNKWTFDLLLGFSADGLTGGSSAIDGYCTSRSGTVIAGPGQEEMAFLLNPYNLRSRTDHFVANGRFGETERHVG